MVEARELHRILSQALLAASKDSTLPMLCGVQLSVVSGKLWAASTDRFVVHAGYTDSDSEEFEAFLPADALASVVKLAKGGVRDERTVIIGVSDSVVEFDFSDGSKAAVVKGEVEFPKWRNLFVAYGPSESVRFNSALLERLCKAVKLSRKDGRAEWKFAGCSKPSLVSTDGFVGLIMPIRAMKDETFDLPDGLFA